MLAGAAAGLAGVLALGGVRLVPDTVSAIEYWSRNASIWRSPLQWRVVAPSVPLAALVVLFAVPAAWAAARARLHGRVLMLAVLALTLALYAVQSLNRPDIAHLRWVIWPATLILAVVIRSLTEPTPPLLARRDHAMAAALVLLTGVCIESFSDRSIVRTMPSGLADNLRAAFGAVPTDRQLAGPALSEVADLVAATGRCTFAANNAGIVYLLARTPPCSRFAFGTYVAPDRQAEVVAELTAARPEVVLWESDAWWSRIDGKTFHDRTPALADWIEAEFPVRTVVGRHVLLSRAPLSRSASDAAGVSAGQR